MMDKFKEQAFSENDKFIKVMIEIEAKMNSDDEQLQKEADEFLEEVKETLGQDYVAMQTQDLGT